MNKVVKAKTKKRQNEIETLNCRQQEVQELEKRP